LGNGLFTSPPDLGHLGQGATGPIGGFSISKPRTLSFLCETRTAASCLETLGKSEIVSEDVSTCGGAAVDGEG